MRKEIPHIIGAYLLGSIGHEELLKAIDYFAVETAVFLFGAFLYLAVQVDREADLERLIFLFIKIFVVFGFIRHDKTIIGYFEAKINYKKLFSKKLLTTMTNYIKLL
jgi:hypothetical protein